MGERLQIFDATWWWESKDAQGRTRPALTLVMLESWSEPKDGKFNLAIHRPDGSVFNAVGHKSWNVNILGQKHDSFAILDTKEEDVPKGSFLELLPD